MAGAETLDTARPNHTLGDYAMMAKLYAVPLAAWVIAGTVVSIVGIGACLWWIVKENRE